MDGLATVPHKPHIRVFGAGGQWAVQHDLLHEVVPLSFGGGSENGPLVQFDTQGFGAVRAEKDWVNMDSLFSVGVYRCITDGVL